MNANVSDEGRVPAVLHRHGIGKSKKPKAPARARSGLWLVAGLLILSGCLLIFGVLRLIQLAGGAIPAGTVGRGGSWLDADC